MNNIDIMTKKKATGNWVADEVERCLSCFDPPCQQACPAHIPIPDFIRAIKSGNVKQASKLIRLANPIASICGEVCPEEVFCQSSCTRSQIDSPIKIRELHGYATKQRPVSISGATKSKGTVAIIGSGPAGLACARQLALEGVQVVIHEKDDTIGGVPTSSIPHFRLSHDIIESDIDHIKKLGVKISLNSAVDNPQNLLNDSNAVFLATGLPSGKGTNVSGSELPQVLSAIAFLNDVKEGKAKEIQGKRFAIIGGGNVSLDVAASAVEAGASEVHLLYRRGPVEMKVWRTELEEAQDRGVVIDYLVTPVEYVEKDGKLQTVRCIRTKLTDDIDSSRRRRTVAVEGTEFDLPSDIVIEAIGLDSEFARDIKVNPDLTTSVDGLFAGGDWARGEGTIVEAVRDGKLAAEKIISYLKDKKL